MTAVPERGRSICLPELSRWQTMAEQNRKATSPFKLIDKHELRAEVFRLSSNYMKRLGLDAVQLDTSKPLLLSGHQSSIIHSGIIYKYRLLSEAAGFTPLWISVDTDYSAGFPLSIPTIGSSPHLVTRLMNRSSMDSFFSDAVADPEQLSSFLQQVVEDMDGLSSKRFKNGIQFLQQRLSGVLPASMRDISFLLRHDYSLAWGGAVAELPLSVLCGSPLWFCFVYELLLKAEETASYFNEILADYRKEHQLRSKANPFPDLDIKNGLTETLFWQVDGNKRKPLMVKVNGSTVFINGSAIASPEQLQEHCRISGINIWARAVSLSMLNRLLISDLFLHGMGGAGYDKITDRLIERLFGTAPPAYAAASCSPGKVEVVDPNIELQELRQQQREMKFHPESFLPEEEPLKQVVERKQQLVNMIKQDGADKKTIGQEIANINKQLEQALLPIKAELQQKVDALDIEAKLFNVVNSRELPFFFLPPHLVGRCD